MIIFLNGKFLTQEEAQIPVNDRGLLLGDGLFETLYYDGKKLEGWAAHWQRLQKGLKLFQIPLSLPKNVLKDGVTAVIAANGLTHQTASVRITLTRGRGERGLAIPSHCEPSIVIQVAPYQRSNQKLKLALSQYTHAGKSVLSSVKHLGYQLSILGRLEARSKEVDDVLFANKAGEIVGATAANVFAVFNDRIITPPLSSGCLPGTKRREIINRFTSIGWLVIEHPLRVQDILAEAEALFLTNSLIDLQSIESFEGHKMPFIA